MSLMSKHYRSEHYEMGTSRRLVHIYQGGTILNILCYQSCSVLTTVGLVWLSTILILSSFALLKYSSSLGFGGITVVVPMIILTFVMISMCCRTCASAGTASDQLIENLKKGVGRKDRRDFLPLRPVRISVGIFFRASKSTILTVTTNCVSTLITLLLSF